MNRQSSSFWFLLFLSFCVIGQITGRSYDEWKTRTIYQLLTDRFARTDSSTSPCSNIRDYCGGTFQGIKNMLPYIKGMGFDAIWISPIVENTPQGFHGYWLKNLTNVNPYFGSEKDLIELITECHKQDIWVMLDVVFNHVGITNDFSTISPFNSAYYYHDCNGCPSGCTITDYQCFTTQIEHCRLAGLPDLNHDLVEVQKIFSDWLKHLIKDYQIDGFRVDTVPYVKESFWPIFLKAIGNTYSVGEVFSDLNCVSTYATKYFPDLAYPLFFSLRDVFTGKADFQSWSSTMKQWIPTSFSQYESVFIDNHDNPRFLSLINDKIAYKSALTVVLMMKGIPIVYYGTEQAYAGGADPYNRETLWTSQYNTQSDLYTFLQLVVNFRKNVQIWNYDQQERAVDSQFYGFSRGSVFVAVTNQKNQIVRSVTNHPYSEGTKVCNLFYPSDCVVVKNGALPIYLDNGESKIFFPSSSVLTIN